MFTRNLTSSVFCKYYFICFPLRHRHTLLFREKLLHLLFRFNVINCDHNLSRDFEDTEVHTMYATRKNKQNDKSRVLIIISSK